MSDDDIPLKSAVELAMERLQASDREAGVDAPRVLTDAEKARIAELRSESRARMAQIEILYRDRRSADDDPVKLAELDEHYEVDRRRIESDVEGKIARIKEGRPEDD
ncbi:MAG: hypothetical protein OEV00_04040 [Acidobacteriota bacterium]|nr:hypothetical protein [Acidobacteriota bacterium]MDH3784483.1 hypothetical protein [Acidobacteriota bacterium]